MIKIGITGSISSGKTTVVKIISHKRGPVFSADKCVKKLYGDKKTKAIIAKKLSIKSYSNFKSEIKNKILSKKNVLRKLEIILHPLVRRKMYSFLKKNKSSKFIFFEIPLLIESNLMNIFDKIIFVKSQQRLRFKRYKKNGGDPRLFQALDSHQLKDYQKIKYCDDVVVNNKSLSVLKKKVLHIIKYYE